MNVALPTIVVFLALLPGFISRFQFKRAERTSLDYSPFGKVVAEAVLWAAGLHAIWIAVSYYYCGKYVDVAILLKVLGPDPSSRNDVAISISEHSTSIITYFGTMLSASYLIPTFIRFIVTHFKLDRINGPLSAFFRFNAPWYYLLTGADFIKGSEPDLISISAIVNIAGQPYLYNGVLDDFYVNADGELDRLILEMVTRRPLSSDKSTAPAETENTTRFYPIDGDYFVLRYSEAITINIQYIKLVDDKAKQENTYPRPPVPALLSP